MAQGPAFRSSPAFPAGQQWFHTAFAVEDHEGAPACHASEGDRPDVKPGKIFLPGRCDVILFRHISSPLPAPGTAAALSAEHISCVSGKTAGSD